MDKLKIKWSGKEFNLGEAGVTEDTTIVELQDIIYKLTEVLPEHQKLFGVKFKDKNVDTLKSCKVKPTAKLMMMGSVQKEIQAVQSISKEDLGPELVDDFDDGEYENVAVENQEIYLNKIERRVNEYPVKIFNKPREGAKLLVLDIDYTLFDHRSPAERAIELQRPYLHEFLTRAYTKGYDIIIWSATGMKWIEAKMNQLGVYNNPNYKIVCYLDSLAMIEVYLEEKGLKRVKPLGTIWGKTGGKDSFEDNMRPKDHEKADKSGPPLGKYYNPKNTIMFDDVKRNFIMNPKNGLTIKPFRDAHFNRGTDNELELLSDFLEKIYDKEDFRELDLKKWKKYL